MSTSNSPSDDDTQRHNIAGRVTMATALVCRGLTPLRMPRATIGRLCSSSIMSGTNGDNENESSRDRHDRSPIATTTSLLEPFKLFGWRPRTARSIDDNYMEMVMLVTRNSICLQGYMACIIVDPTGLVDVMNCSSATNSTSIICPVQHLERHLYGAIRGIATNQPLFSSLDSDVHAEIGALGLACRNGNATEGCTAYITMPPCKKCFAALCASGISRIVSRRLAAESILEAADKRGIEMVVKEESPELLARIQLLVQGETQDELPALEKQLEIEESRKRRKEEKKRRKEEKRRRREEDPAFQKKM